MTELRKRIMQMGSSHAEVPFFRKEVYKYIITSVNAQSHGGNYARRISLDFAPTYRYNDTYLWGVSNPTNTSRNKLGIYYTSSDGAFYPTAVAHSGNASSVAHTSTVELIANKRIKIELMTYSNQTCLIVNGIAETSFINPSSLYTYAYNINIGFGARYSADTTSWGYWSGNIYDFSIYNSRTEDDNYLVYRLTPKMVDGVYVPYEVVSETYPTWEDYHV